MCFTIYKYSQLFAITLCQIAPLWKYVRSVVFEGRSYSEELWWVQATKPKHKHESSLQPKLFTNVMVFLNCQLLPHRPATHSKDFVIQVRIIKKSLYIRARINRARSRTINKDFKTKRRISGLMKQIILPEK